MRCPKCGKPGAYLWHEDGITAFGDKEVQIKHNCKPAEMASFPKQVASVKISVSQIRPLEMKK